MRVSSWWTHRLDDSCFLWKIDDNKIWPRPASFLNNIIGNACRGRWRSVSGSSYEFIQNSSAFFESHFCDERFNGWATFAVFAERFVKEKSFVTERARNEHYDPAMTTSTEVGLFRPFGLRLCCVPVKKLTMEIKWLTLLPNWRYHLRVFDVQTATKSERCAEGSTSRTDCDADSDVAREEIHLDVRDTVRMTWKWLFNYIKSIIIICR